MSKRSVESMTAREREILDKAYEDCLSSRKRICSICRDDWHIANSLAEDGLLEFQQLIDDRAWWITNEGIDIVKKFPKE